MSNIVVSNAQTLAQALSIQGDPQELVNTLKATAFKGQVTDAQMAALLVVANQYGLNPWTKEIYAFPDRNNGIVQYKDIAAKFGICRQHAGQIAIKNGVRRNGIS